MPDLITWDSLDWQLPDDCDLINVTIEPNAVDPSEVAFVLESGDNVSWWKGLVVPDGTGSRWEISTENDKKSDTVSLWAGQVNNGQELVFRKAKQWGNHTDVYRLGGLGVLLPGTRVTFRWVRDSCSTNSAWFESQSVPPWMKPGEVYDVSIAMSNVLDYAEWSPELRYKLGSQNPQDNVLWGVNRIPVASRVGYWAGYVFKFRVTAPTTPGKYNFQWQMLQEGVEWFGQKTPVVQIDVSMVEPPPPPPPPPPEMTIVPNVVRMVLKNATTTLYGANLGIGLVFNPTQEIRTDSLTVTHQSMNAGSAVEANTAINLRVDGLPPQGVKLLGLYNCHTDRRALHIWVFDMTTGTYKYEGRIAAQYDIVSDICPSPGATGFPLTFATGHSYIIVAVDEGWISGVTDVRDLELDMFLGLRDSPSGGDPANASSQRWSVRLTGDSSGYAILYSIS